MHEVVPSAVRNAVSAATTTFTAISINLCFLIFSLINCFLNFTQIPQISQIFVLRIFYCPAEIAEIAEIL